MRCPALSVAGKKQYLGHDGSHRSSKKRTQKLKECLKLGFQLFLLVNVELKQLIPATDKLKLHHRDGTMGSYLACQSTFHRIKKKTRLSWLKVIMQENLGFSAESGQFWLKETPCQPRDELSPSRSISCEMEVKPSPFRKLYGYGL